MNEYAHETELLGGMTTEEFFSGVSEEARPLVDAYDELWKKVHDELEQPYFSDVLRFSGYTGHRIVDMGGRMGRCALGFHLTKTSSDVYRHIIASRRKIYVDNRRRKNYTADELSVASLDLARTGPRGLQVKHDIGVLGVWLDKFVAAEQ